jgi:hypothetical protein
VESQEVWQFARILGKSDFLSCLALSKEEDLQTLTPEQLERIHECAAQNVNKIARTLVHEAASEQDIQTAAQAQEYLERRLAFFGDMLTDDLRAQIRQGYTILTATWG